MTFKRNNLLPLLACNVLLHAFQTVSEWPTEFIQAYIEDSFGDRVWVDDENARTFVENVITAFPTPPTTIEPKVTTSTVQRTTSSSNFEEHEDELESGNVVVTASSKTNRYPDEYVRDRIRLYLLDMINNHLVHQVENPKNLIKVLTTTASYKDIRVKASELLEEWLNNPSTLRFAKELINRVVLFSRESTQEDFTTLANILKMRIKGMQTQLHYDAVTQLLKNNADYPSIGICVQSM